MTLRRKARSTPIFPKTWPSYIVMLGPEERSRSERGRPNGEFEPCAWMDNPHGFLIPFQIADQPSGTTRGLVVCAWAAGGTGAARRAGAADVRSAARTGVRA